MRSIIRTSIAGQEILGSPIFCRNNIGIGYAVADLGDVWLSGKEVFEIRRAGLQATCHLIGRVKEAPEGPLEKPVWGLCYIQPPDTDPME
jgi:hypothetical protein